MGTRRMQINFAYRPWVGPSAVTTLHISWPSTMMTVISRQSDCDNPAIWPNVQRTHTSISVQISQHKYKDTTNHTYKHAIIVMDRLLLRCFSKLSLHFCTPDLSASLKVNMQQTQYLNILDSFHILYEFPIPCQIYKKEQLHKTVVLKSVDACNRKLVTQGERES